MPSSTPAHLDLFRYLAAEERVEYVAIMTRFTASLLADMSAVAVAEQLARDGLLLDADVVESRCRQLVRWGNLVPSLRDARVTTVQDYLRARSRYQVSSLGGRVHRSAVEIMDAADGAREVARELLGEIAESLSEVMNTVQLPMSSDRADRLAGIVTTIFNNQRLFTASVTDFYAYLAGVLSRFDLHGAEYAQFKGLLLDYVDLITADVNRHAPLIADRLTSVSQNLDEILAVLDSLPRLELGDLAAVDVRAVVAVRTGSNCGSGTPVPVRTRARRSCVLRPVRRWASCWSMPSGCSTRPRRVFPGVPIYCDWRVGSTSPETAKLIGYSPRRSGPGRLGTCHSGRKSPTPGSDR